MGIDLVDISRFERFTDSHDAFLVKVFTPSELAYCFTFKEPKSHLAGIFACKEAASKALGIHEYPFALLEVLHDDNGKPEIFYQGKKMSVAVSITHTDTVAAAIAAL